MPLMKLTVLRAHILIILAAALVPIGVARLSAQKCAPGELRVIVIDSQESPVFDAEVRVNSETASIGARSTQAAGLADFENIPCGAWSIAVTKEGFEPSTKLAVITSAGRVE